MGFTLHPLMQGRGVASAAVRAALQLFFGATGARQVQGVTDALNLPSIRLLARLGFEFQESRSVLFRGAPCLEHVYLLRRQEG